MCVLFSPVPACPPPAHQERAELAAGRRHLEARQALYAELRTQLDNCPESVREQLQEQLRRVSVPGPLSSPEGHPPRRKIRALPRVTRAHFAAPAGIRVCAVAGGGREAGGLRFFLLLWAGMPLKAAEPRRHKGGLAYVGYW